MLMKKLLAAAILLTAVASSAYSACWNLVWQDEFNGQNINTANWNFNTGCSGWGNNEWENYTNSTANAYIENGNLVLNAVNTGGGNCGYTSARLTTQGKVHYTYGRIEARIKCPYGQGIWPAFWLLGENIGSVGWPACGEIDIMEMVGGGSGRDNTTAGTAHWDNSGHASYGLTASVGWPAKLYDDYHIYAIEWDASQIRWYFDSNNYCTLNTNGASMEEFVGRDYFILLNLAVGGNWPGYPDGSTVFPQKMYIDYVRWYQDGACGPTNTPQPTPTLVINNIPGNVQFEDYMNSGEGVSYHDTTAGNTPGQYRNDGVDIEVCSEAGSGYDIGYTEAGEWLNYRVNVVQPGTYSIGVHVASLGAGGTFHLELDGNGISGTLTVPDTGGWQTWQTLDVNNITISSTGLKTLKLVMDGNGSTGGIGNFNYVSFTTSAYTPTQTQTVISATFTPVPSYTPQPGSDVLIPLNSGKTMTCQFINNTGNYSDSQIYVIVIGLNAAMKYCRLDTSGNMIPCVSGDNASGYFIPLSSINGLQFPDTMISVRLYVSLGSALNIPFNTDGGGNVGIAYPNIDNPFDPSYSVVFDFVEFNLQGNTIFLNSSQVDMFGVPIQLRLYDNGTPAYTLNGQMGIPYSMAQIVSDWVSQVPAEFQHLYTNGRIVAPAHGHFATGRTYANYFDSYINSIWGMYASSDLVLTIGASVYTGRVGGDGRLAFTAPGDPATYYVSKPTTQDVFMGAGALASGNGVEKQLEAQICAAFNRHVLQNISLANTPSAFYQASPANWYAKFWHDHSLNNLAYGFCYDDVSNQSTTLVSTNPRGMVVVIGANSASPTFTQTRTMTAVNTETSTFTATLTETRTNTLTFTAIQTPLNSATRTATAPAATLTATNTNTLTAISTATRTATAPAAASTVTGTSTAIVTNTRTQTAVKTVTYTPTISNTVQNTSTRTATQTSSLTPLFTFTPGASASASVSPKNTDTNTPTFTNTSSPTASMSATQVWTNTAVNTFTFTAAPSNTASFTSTRTFTPAATRTFTVTSTATTFSANTHTPTATKTQNGKLEIKDLVAYPNPNTNIDNTGINISFKLSGNATKIKFRLFTAGHRFIREVSFTADQVTGSLTTGSNIIIIPPKYFKGIAAGTYYYVLNVEDGYGNKTSSGLKIIIVIR
jgi:beta-glucanase (GH16 family)